MLTSHFVTALNGTQYSLGNDAGLGVGFFIGYIVVVIALWPLLVKAHRPGWGALVPIFNLYLLVKIAELHGALTILFLIPFVNIIMGAVVALGVGRAFGRGPVFSLLLLWLFPVIGYYILGYGSARYEVDGGV